MPLLQHSWKRLLCVWMKSAWADGEACSSLILLHPPQARSGTSVPRVDCPPGSGDGLHSGLPITSLLTPWPSVASVSIWMFASSGKALHSQIPHKQTLCICKASSEDPLGSWTFPLCKPLATLWPNTLQGDWSFCDRIHSMSVLMDSSAIYWPRCIPLHPWRVCASCMKLGCRSQNCKTSSQIPAGMHNLATWHSAFAPLSYFPC